MARHQKRKQAAKQLIQREKRRIFRLVHVSNIPWLLENGLQCPNSEIQDEHYAPIGDPDLIEKRDNKKLSIGPGETLSDYIPFYFTPWSPMQYRIRVGRQGTLYQEATDLAFIVASIPELQEQNRSFLVSDRHAKLSYATFTINKAPIDTLPWRHWQDINFNKQSIDIDIRERYQAEVLVHQELPLRCTLGLALYDNETRDKARAWVADAGLILPVLSRPLWYFQ